MRNIEILKETFCNFFNQYENLCLTNHYNKKNYLKRFLKLIKRGKFQEVHHTFCELMFEMVEVGEELWVRIDHIYNEDDKATLREKETKINERGNYIEISILTPTILKYDQIMFDLLSDENTEDIYRPYFLHFLIDLDEVGDEAFDFIKNPDRLNQWYTGSFSQNFNEDSVREFPGYIEKIASPVIYSGRKLKVIDRLLPVKVVNEINTTYVLGKNPCSKDIDLHNELNKLLGGTNFTHARIYNVGTGNCMYLYGKNKRLLYDIGYHISAIPAKSICSSKKPRVAQAIRSLRPNCIILSHWDSDHYKGCAYANRRIFECRWIAPNCNDATPNAKRLAKYLYVKKKLLLVDRMKGRKIAHVDGSISKLTLWMGESVTGVKEDRKITKANREGIVLELYNEDKDSDSVHSIMMGDVPYSSLPTVANFAISTPYDYLVVPHHGAYMNCDLLTKSTNIGVAIVCAIKGVNRPNTHHEVALYSNGYSVILTEEADFSIELNLTKKTTFYYRN